MDKIVMLENVSQYNALMGQETLHPLVSVIDFSKVQPTKHVRMNLGFFAHQLLRAFLRSSVYHP